MKKDVNREEQIFEAALQFPTPEQQAAFVKGVCGNDEGLSQRVEALLRAHHTPATSSINLQRASLPRPSS